MQIITASQALTPQGWARDVQITIGADGRIESLRPMITRADAHLDMVIPAPVNLHSHSFQRAMAGLTEARGPDPADSFWTWRRQMYCFLDRLEPDQIEAIAAMVFMEMLEAGYGAVAEFHYLHHAAQGKGYDDIAELSARIVAAAQQAGIGLTLLPVLYQWGGCDARPLMGGQLRFGNDPERFARLHAGAAQVLADHGHADDLIGTAPHSLRAVDAAGLEAALALCPEGPVHMHLAEQQAELAEVEAHLGARPVEWLLDHHAVDPRWCLIHCTQMTKDETRALAATDAVAGLCPITESSLGDGIFNGVTYLGAEGRIGAGSDSNIHIAYFDELRTLEYSQRLRDHGRAVLATQAHSTGRRLIDETLAGGAQAAGRASGALAPGYLADLVGMSTDNEWLCDRAGDVALDTLIFGGHGAHCITDVWSAGRHVVQHGRHRDRDAICRRFRATMAQLRDET
ncbi:8-oxoguanine deaminase [Roseovarius tolerans]|uniref:8-oxoguanine deaminase n=1 Tax=Roseovarius tolerans TaxID=74031 RepID=A0A0L6CSF9_9RHOB|nr:formimidoylglutamate deiminase [Roseovarius tolerans]KNX40448.1 8-oxoguanine deaminase [Roseovarius tolerans]